MTRCAATDCGRPRSAWLHAPDYVGPDAHAHQPPKPKVKRTQPMRRHSLTNARAVVWRDEYLPARLVFLAVHPDCEMNITTPAICPAYPHPATEIQHQVQVSLDPSIENLLDETHWLASCHQANTWCGRHPVEAEALGLEMRPQTRDAARRSA